MTFTKEQKTHHLKIYPEHFSAVLTGVKRAELRKNDRDFKVGDTLHLMETPKGSCSPTGEFVNAVVTHIADVGDWLPGYVLLSIEREPAYTASPAPVSVQISFEEWSRKCDLQIQLCDPEFREKAQYIWNACRSAMLQGAEPVNKRDDFPFDYLQGQKDGLEWAAQLAEANHPQTGDWLYDDPIELAKAIRKGPDMPEPAGNSPTTPDGWVACSERMPDIGTEIFYFCQDDGLRDCGIVSSSNFSGRGDAQLYVHADGYDLRFGVDITHWMPLPAAPRQGS